jgi:hypothetical protein
MTPLVRGELPEPAMPADVHAEGPFCGKRRPACESAEPVEDRPELGVEEEVYIQGRVIQADAPAFGARGAKVQLRALVAVHQDRPTAAGHDEGDGNVAVPLGLAPSVLGPDAYEPAALVHTVEPFPGAPEMLILPKTAHEPRNLSGSPDARDARDDRVVFAAQHEPEGIGLDAEELPAGRRGDLPGTRCFADIDALCLALHRRAGKTR